MREIMIKGKFSLRYKTYLGDKKAGIKDIEIVKWQGDGEYKTCYTIADFNKDGDLVSCGMRLMEALETLEDRENVQALSIVAQYIVAGDDEVCVME